MRRRQGGGAVEGEEVAAAGHDDDPNDGGEELVNPILLLIYGVGLVVPLPDMAERIEVLRAAAGIEMQGEEGDDEGRHGGVRAFNAAARVHRNRIDSTDRRDIECLGNLIFGPMFPT